MLCFLYFFCALLQNQHCQAALPTKWKLCSQSYYNRQQIYYTTTVTSDMMTKFWHKSLYSVWENRTQIRGIAIKSRDFFCIISPPVATLRLCCDVCCSKQMQQQADSAGAGGWSWTGLEPGRKQESDQESSSASIQLHQKPGTVTTGGTGRREKKGFV